MATVEQSTGTGFTHESVGRILAMTRKLASHFDLDCMLVDVVEVGKSLLDSAMGSLWLYEADAHELVMVVPRLDPPMRVKEGEGLVGACAATRSILNVPDAAKDARFIDSIGRTTGFRACSILNVPLVARDHSLIGVLQLLDERQGGYDQYSEMLATTLAAQCSLALQYARMSEAMLQSGLLSKEVEVAREIQRSTLPTEMPSVPGYDLHGHFLPATYAGGDLFDMALLDQGLFLLLGDATGHGFGPALSATQMQGMLRVAFRLGADLDSAYLHVNNQLAEDLPDDRFITAFMGFLDPSNHSIRFHSAGQGPILHFRAAGQECDWHGPSTFPVGILEIEQAGNPTVLHLEPGDILALISDGLYEYAGPNAEEFGEQRIAELLLRHHALPMPELCERMLAAVEEFADGAPQEDDITVVLVRRLP
jgi:phosphoserine phosphatase